MHDISLVTSLYRSEAFLKEYTRQVLDVAAHLKQDAGLMLEVVIVANDASEDERRWIRELTAGANMAGTPTIFPIYVERETLYASWNRGIQASSGRCVGVWNVDDVRTAGALAEGHQMISQGCGLVYFPFTLMYPSRLIGMKRELYKAPPFNYDVFTKKMRSGPFIMFGRDTYDEVGPFGEHFKIAGDFDWCIRAADRVKVCPGTQHAGIFKIHGSNLSNVGNPLQQVEINIIQLRREAWANVDPADPELMRTLWEAWGSEGRALPPEIAERLWGAGSAERWKLWLKQEVQRRQRVMVSETLRKFPRYVINHTGLRPFFARLGIVKSAYVD
jgi:glycosyltransferase involved in cell wall biosynthesis